jgi:hypothetical protein
MATKHTKWLNRVVSNVVIEDDGSARLYLGIIEIDYGKITPQGILRKNGMYVKDADEWVSTIEKLLGVCY